MRPVTLLDLDGCILDSSEPILRSLGAALVAVGLEPITRGDLGRVVGPPLAETVPRLLAERGATDVEAHDVMRLYREDYRASSIDLARCYPGITDVIDELARSGRIGVVTSKPLAYTEPILTQLGLLDRFEVVEGPSRVENEPKTVTLGRALERLRAVGAPAVVMVGDRHHDIEAGRAHGLGTVGVTWGFGSADELLAAGADGLAHEPETLPGVVGDIAGGGSPATS